jgi:hypothetical protein
VGSLIVSAVFWTWVILRLFGGVDSSTTLFLWTSAVFGTWAVLLIPFIQAKETVMGHVDKEDARMIIQWMGWIAVAVASFLASEFFWAYLFEKTGGPIFIWLVAVFGTWLVLAVPLGLVLYRKIMGALARAQTAARAEEDEAKQRSVDLSGRLLRDSLQEKLTAMPETLWGAHIVTGVLSDGSVIPPLVVRGKREIVGIHGARSFSFQAKDIVDVLPVREDQLSRLEANEWYWVDGRV